MSKVRVPGSVYRRSSSRWAAMTSPLFDSGEGRRRRISLGTFSSREDALLALVEFNRSRSTADVGRQRLSDYLVEWLRLVRSQVEVGHLARRTASGYREAVEIHVVPALGRLRVDDLNHLVVHDWLTSLRTAKALSDQTVLRVYRTLHRAMADAPMSPNPVALPKHMRPVVRSRRETIRPSPAEIGEFLTHTARCELSVYLHPLWRLAAVSGMRRGELVGLAWSDIDLDADAIQVGRSLGMDGGEVFVKAPKSAAGHRLVGLDVETTSVLSTHRRRLAADRLAAGEEYEIELLGLDLMFRVGPDGALMRPDMVSRMFTREWAHSGLRKGVTLHSLRHTMASLLVAEGFPLTEVADRLGHSVEVLQRTYARDLDPKNRESRMVEVISSKF